MLLSIDHGAGNIKLHGAAGTAIVPTQVAIAGRETLGRTAGLRTGTPPLRIRLDGHEFYVGAGAHDWGRPVENLDDTRFVSGAPETVALTYAALTRYMEMLNLTTWYSNESVQVIVGLPQTVLADDQTHDTVAGIRRWLVNIHAWDADSTPHGIPIVNVITTSQAAGALFDYLLDDNGAFIPDRKSAFKREIGVLSIGMNTLEMMAVENGTVKQRFTDSQTVGVRRLLELCDPAGLYSRGELDSQLRAGTLEGLASALPIWKSEIYGTLERAWGAAFRRFAVVIVVGGGATLLRDITTRFDGRAYVPDDPVASIACGLYKLGMMRSVK